MPPRMDMPAHRRPGQGTSAMANQQDSDVDLVAAIRPQAAAATSTPAAASASATSSFEQALAELENFFELGSQVGQDISEGFAKIINRSVRARPNDEHLKELSKKYYRPANVPNLEVPRLNPEVWEQLRKGSLIVDSLLQKIQTLLSKAISIMLHILDKVGSEQGGQTEDHLQEMSDCLRCLGAMFSLLNHTRKDLVRNDAGEPLSRLCTWETPVGTDKLFDVDVPKAIEDRDKAAQRLKKKRRQYKWVHFTIYTYDLTYEHIIPLLMF